MIEVQLYGKLRRFAEQKKPTAESVVYVPYTENLTIEKILEIIGIPHEEVGKNIFLDGEYSELTREVQSGQRLGIFPDDMQLLYKWYFVKKD